MKIFKKRNKLQKEISDINNISFVPTMGGLHNGHKYLIKNAKKKGSKVENIYAPGLGIQNLFLNDIESVSV